MNERIRQLIAAGESRTVEFKAARDNLPRNVYDTVCAFLNREGGDILLGVRDDGTVSGVEPSRVDALRQDFVNAINNPQKISPPCYLSIESVEVDGARVLHIFVPQSSQVHRHANRIFDRNEDGDFDITNNQMLVAQMYARKQAHYSETTIYPQATLADLDTNLIDRARKLASLNRANHPWSGMNDEDLVASAQLSRRDFVQGGEGLTLEQLSKVDGPVKSRLHAWWLALRWVDA